MGPSLVLSLSIRVDQGVMAMKENSIFPKTPEVEPYDQMG